MLKKRIDKLFRDVVLRYAEDQSKILIEQRPENPKDSVPELSYRRLEKMLERELGDEAQHSKETKQKMHHQYRGVSRVVQKVIVAVAAFIVIMFTTMMSSEAVRARITAFLVSITPQYAEIGLENYEELDPQKPVLYELGYVPDGFILLSEELTVGQTIRYQKNEDQILVLHVTSSTSVSQIDTENAVEIKYVAIKDETGLMVIEKDWITLTWSNESTVFVLGGTISEEEIITIAENVKKK
jgi:hypothetical protein